MYFFNTAFVTFLCCFFASSPCLLAESSPDISVCYNLNPCVVVKRIEQKPIIDGLLNDSIWKTAENCGNFVTSNGERKVEDQTEFKVCYDDENLYIAVIAYDSSVGSLRKVITNRDGMVWVDDCIEIFIDSNCDGKSHYHFIINPIGTIYDAYAGINGKEDSKWNCPIRVKTRIKADVWQIELALPLSSIGVDISKVKKVGFNVCREQRSRDGVVLSQWCPSLNPKGSFWVSGRSAGILWFGKREGIIKDAKLIWRDGRIVLNGSIEGINNKNTMVNVSYSPADSVRQWKSIRKNVRSNRVLLSINPTLAKSYFFRVELWLDGCYCPDDIIITKIVLPQQIKLSIVSPAYKRCIFPDQKIKEIKAYVKSDFDGQIEVEFRNSQKDVLYHKRFSNAKVKEQIVIPCAKLDVGRYVLSAKLIRNGQVLSVANKVIRKLKDKRGIVRISKDKILLRDGKPMMPIGYLGFTLFNGFSCEKLSKESVNAGHTYYCRSGNDKALQALLDQSAKAGIGILIYPFSGITQKDSKNPRLSEADKKEITEKVNRYKNHPGLLGWYLADEPEIHGQPVSRYMEVYELISELDPYHPCIMLNDTLSVIRNYAVACDVTMPDPYIVPRKTGLPLKPMTYVSGFMDVASSTGKLVWITPQAFDYAAYTIARRNTRAPTYREERCMTYLAMIHGARGFLYFALPYIMPDADLRIGMPYLTKELGAISEMILNGRDLRRLKTSSRKIEAVFKRNNNSYLLISVNSSPRPINASIEVPENISQMKVLSENRTIKVVGGKIHDVFKRYDTHIYYVNIPAADKLTSINIIEKQIAEFKKKVKDANRDNLAFVGNGAVVKASTYKFSIWLNDGIIDEPTWSSLASEKRPAWVEISLPNEQVVSKVVVNATPFYSHSVKLNKFSVYVDKNNVWRKVSTFSDNSNKRKIIECSFNPVSTNKIRIEFFKPSYITIAEIQVYGKSK